MQLNVATFILFCFIATMSTANFSTYQPKTSNCINLKHRRKFTTLLYQCVAFMRLLLTKWLKLNVITSIYRQYFDTIPQSVNILTHHGNNLSISTYFFVNNQIILDKLAIIAYHYGVTSRAN